MEPPRPTPIRRAKRPRPDILPITPDEIATFKDEKEKIDKEISNCHAQLMEIWAYIEERNAVKKKISKEKTTHAENLYFFSTNSLDFVESKYSTFLKISNKPGVKTMLELYARCAEPKTLEYRMTATIQAHSAEVPNIQLRNNNVLTLSLSGRPGESGIMMPVENINTFTGIVDTKLNTSNYSWPQTITSKLSFLGPILAPITPNVVRQKIKSFQPKTYGIDFWWSWYTSKFNLYTPPTLETKRAMYEAYLELKKNLSMNSHNFSDFVKIYGVNHPSANLYVLARFLRDAWKSIGITFPGGGFNIICATRDRLHYLEPNKDELPELCPTYGISISETTNPDDNGFTNKTLPFLMKIAKYTDEESTQKYVKFPHLVDGANIAPMPDKMLENVKATYSERCTETYPNINLLDQQLYWLNKIFVFCKDDPNQMVYYACLFLNMVVDRRTTHSDMINMFQQGMGYILTCLDPSCRHIPKLHRLAGAAMQIAEYSDDLINIEEIAKAKLSLKLLCHYVERQYNDGGIWTRSDVDDLSEDIIEIINRNINAADSKLSTARSAHFMRIIKYVMSVKEDVDVYGSAQAAIDKIFKRYMPLMPQIKFHRPSRVSPSRIKTRRVSPSSSGGKMSSTRKRVALIRRIRSRKNKRCIRYTKNKK